MDRVKYDGLGGTDYAFTYGNCSSDARYERSQQQNRIKAMAIAEKPFDGEKLQEERQAARVMRGKV